RQGHIVSCLPPQRYAETHSRARRCAPVRDDAEAPENRAPSYVVGKGMTVTELQWAEIDRRAVDTARILAADAVEKVGNGHPGTAMSLAPAAYLLYQRVLRHDPSDVDWLGRDRFILSAGHSSLTQYVQLYL